MICLNSVISHCDQFVRYTVTGLPGWLFFFFWYCNQKLKIIKSVDLTSQVNKSRPVTRLLIQWRLRCETGNLVSPESQLLEHQAWWSRAFARTMSRHGLLFNSIGPDLAKPRLKISLLTQARPALHFFLVRPGPGLDLIWLLGPCLDNFVWTVNYFRIRFFSLFVWKKSHFIINKFYFLTTLAGQL